MPEDLTAKAFAVAKKVAKAVDKVTNCDGINILQNNGEVAGQTVFHFHITLYQRHKGDTVDIKFGEINADAQKIAQIGEEIKKNL